MPSTHSNTHNPCDRNWPARSGRVVGRFLSVGRRVSRGLLVVVSAVTLIPISAASSSGAGTTAVAAATNDPLAVAAATALDLLRGGQGNASVRTPATVIDSSAGSSVSSLVGAPTNGAPSSAAETAGSTTSLPNPAQPQSENASNTTIIPYIPPPTRSAAATGDQPSQFANSAPVSMLVPPTEVTVPVTVPTAAPAGSIPTSATTLKKAAKKSNTTTVAVPVAVEGSAPLGKTYDSARRSVVDLLVARLPKLSADRLEQAWAAADPRRMITVYAALAQVGTNYRYSGNEPGGFDCSGLTSYAWSVAGIKIPRTSTDQINATGMRGPDQLLPGDLVWRPGHISMYLGAGEFVIDSPQTGKQVHVRQWGRTSRYGSPI